MKGNRHTFSLEAFQTLLSVPEGKPIPPLASVQLALSPPTPSPQPKPRLHIEIPTIIYTSFHEVPVELQPPHDTSTSEHRRSIVTESECSDNADLRDDEGWIPISCDTTAATTTTVPASPSVPLRREVLHERVQSLSSDMSCKSGSSLRSVFSEVTQEWTPPSTPGREVAVQGKSRAWVGGRTGDTERSVEETMKWIFGYDDPVDAERAES